VSTAPSPDHTVPARASVAELRARIRALEKPGEQGRTSRAFEGVSPVIPPVIPVGVPAIDAHLPDGGLRLAGLHEIAGAREEWDDAVAAGFCLALLGRLAKAPVSRGPIPKGPILWAARRADLYGPGVAGLMAVPPGRLLLVRARRDDQVLWALEEGLRAPAGVLSAVVGEVGEADGTALRRLQLAAERAGRPCFLLRRRLYAGRAAPPRSTSRSTLGAALTHWRVGAVPSSQRGVRRELATGSTGLPGRSRWRVDLLRCRGAAPGTFTVEWDDAAGDFALAAPVRDRPVAPRAAAPSRRAG
jgi:protein ImuA